MGVVAENIPDVGKNIYACNTCLDLNTSIDFINIKLRGAVKNFIQVGIVLRQIDEKELYKDKGFNNIHEFSKHEFKLSKNQTYNLIQVAKRFSLGGSVLDTYKDFSFSQLVEMVSLPVEQIVQLTPKTTVKEIREVKKTIKDKKDIVISPAPVEEKKVVDVKFKEVEKQNVAFLPKCDLAYALQALERAWSNEADDNIASALEKQIQFIRQFHIQNLL